MRLKSNLVLASYLGSLLGDEDGGTTAALRAVSEYARRGDGHSTYFSALEGRADRLGLPLDHVRRYDLNIVEHAGALAARRGDFHGLLYFQYQAALAAEILFDKLYTDPATVLAGVESLRKARFPEVPEVTAETLRTWAFWMATGSGKTLLLHLAVLQFQHYKPFEAANILLLTPGEGLSRQHLEEFTKSGIPARHVTETDAAFEGVQVIEITKLYDDTTPEGTRRTGKGLSRPLSEFEGPNLLLVDEGHKGTFGTSDIKEEKSWRSLRQVLGRDGLTLEYSATFGQVAEAVDDLADFYARTVAFEYAYGRFHADRFGKDYHVLNLKKEQDAYTDTLLLGGLLTLYAQRKAYDEDRAVLTPYHVAQPLMVFVGSKVTGGEAPEVVEVLRFLSRFLAPANKAETVDRIRKMLAGKSEVTGPDGKDAFAAPLESLAGMVAPALYNDLCRRLFHGQGELQIVRLTRAEGEVALRTSGAMTDEYFGVVSVGDADKLLKLSEENGLYVGEPDAIRDSRFDTLRSGEGPLSVLVGAKRFLEGWSSARVSVMGLLGVGKSAGAQVIQLFGRGVRLVGKDRSLRRSAGTAGAPEALGLLEKLHIFGLKADYVQTFLASLDAEDAPAHDLVLPITVDEAALSARQLRIFRKEGARFASTAPLTFNYFPEAPEPPFENVTVVCTPTVAVTTDGKTESGKTDGFVSQKLPMGRLSEDELYYAALDHKRRKGYENLFIPRAAVRRFLRERVLVKAPQDVLEAATHAHRTTLERLAAKAVQDGVDAFYGRHQRRYEAASVVPDVLESTHANFPRVEGAPAYSLRVPGTALEAVQAIVDDAVARQKEDHALPLPRLHVEAHLYAPLVSANAFEVTRGKVTQWQSRLAVSVTPTGLVESEVRFLVDLRTFWETAHAEEAWAGCEVTLLRNLPKTGLEFYDTAGFYPDFLLWLTRGEAQALAFVDPKGMVHWAEEKVGLLAFMETMSRDDLAIRGFIVTPTDPKDIQLPAGMSLSDRNVLLQDDPTYIEAILAHLRGCLLPSTE